MTGIRRVSQLGTTGESTFVDGSITQADLSTAIPLSGMRNMIINGNMVVDQRSTPLSSGGFTADRWFYANAGGSASETVNRGNDAPNGFGYSLQATCMTGVAGNTNFFYQRIEGQNTVSLSWGTSSAKQATISFWVKSSSIGTYSVSIQNSNRTRVYVATYPVNVANIWEYKTITIPGITTGTWEKTTSTGVEISFPFGINSSGYQTSTLNQWFNGDGMSIPIGPSTVPDVMAVSNGTFQITGVQFEQNSQATPFEQRPIGTETALCQRYFHVIPGGNLKAVNQYATVGLSGGNLLLSHSFPVTMRAEPTAYTSSGSGSHSFDFFQSSAGAGVSRVLVYQAGQSCNTTGFKTLAYSSDNNSGNVLPSNGHLIGILGTAVWVSAEL